MRIRFYAVPALSLLMSVCALRAADAPTRWLLVNGWSVLKEGKAEGTAEIDAKNPTNPDSHLLKIAITKYPPFGQGRLGLKNSTSIPVQQGRSYDVTFNGTSEGIGVGLVFSLETDDGKVVARTTLPEIGRGGRGGRRGRGGRGGRGARPTPNSANAPETNLPAATATPPSPWRSYMLSLKAEASSPKAHLVVTAIEPVTVWLENVSVLERQ